jgi:hypothetical protein
MMLHLSIRLFVLMTIFASVAPAQAIEQHGIRIYEGAQLDEQETKFGREIVGADIHCYRTGESVAKVTAFYEHKGTPLINSIKELTGYRRV